MIYWRVVCLVRYLRKAIRLLPTTLLLSNAVGSAVRQLWFSQTAELQDTVQWEECVHWPDDYGITVVHWYIP